MKKNIPTLIQYSVVSIICFIAFNIFFIIFMKDVLNIREIHYLVLLGANFICISLAFLSLKWNSSLVHENRRNSRLLAQAEVSDKLKISRFIDESREHYNSLFNNNLDIVFTMNLEGRFTNINPTGVKLLEYTKSEILEKTFRDIVSPSDLERIQSRFYIPFQGKPHEFETKVISKSGRIIQFNVTVAPIIINQKVTEVICIAKDITDEKISEMLLDHQNNILEMIAKGEGLSDTLQAIIHMAEQHSNVTGSISLADEKQEKLIHYASTSLPKAYLDAIREIPIADNVGSCGTAAYRKELIIVADIANDPLWVSYRDIALANNLRSCWSMPILDSAKEKVLGTFGMYYNEAKAPSSCNIAIIEKAGYLAKLAIEKNISEETIRYLAYHDTVTSLGNRSMFYNEIDLAIEEFSKTNTVHAILYMDLDRFKLVNDTLGHAAGDHLLKDVAQRLLLFKNDNTVVVRLGGDEFALFIKNTSKNKVEQTAKEVIDNLRKPYTLQNTDYYITASIGISFFPTHGEDRSTLIKKADAAMLLAKTEGKNNYRIYHEELNKKSEENLLIEMYLKKAIDLDEFVLHYQPIVKIDSGEIEGVEALIRWNHPKLGFIMPSKFISIAERTGYIIPIGEWVLRQACSQCKAWQQEGLDLSLSINISVKQFQRHNFVETIKKILKETGLHPNYLQLEITESIMMDIEGATEKLLRLKEIGVHIAIDDFGTGYSSLSILSVLPIDRLKIDGTFFSSDHLNNRSIVKSILAMAHNLNMTVTAEGVEREDQVHFLQELHCEYAQGYYYSKPLPVDDMSILANVNR